MDKLAVIESQFLLRYDIPENGITVGGSQRYAMNIGRLLKEMGYDVVFLSKASKEVTVQFEDIGNVYSLVAPNGTSGNRMFSKKVYDFCISHNASVVCYSDLQLAFWKCYENSFALQHGIDWDGPKKSIQTKIQNEVYIKAARKFKKIICVDTNYINWARIHDKICFTQTDRMVYIPNFAEERMFYYVYKEWKNDENEYPLLYPRRLVAHRGYKIFLDMCEKLYKEGYKIRPILAFEDFANEKVVEILKDYECKFDICHPNMNEISDLYRKAFLTYVPTRWSEGTSLSAIESICCGCPVVTSDVGGLANIVIPGFQGDIVAPNVEEFVKITKKVLNNVEIRNEWASNCKYVRDSFGIKRWNDKVKDVVLEVSK